MPGMEGCASIWEGWAIMDRQRELEYYRLFEQLIKEMGSPDGFNREAHKRNVTQICELFHLAKGELKFYRSLSHEKMGQGECYCDFDNGKGEKILVHRRIVTPASSIVIGTIYVENDDVVHTEEDIEKIETMLLAIMSFTSRMRLQQVVEMLGYNDENGYPNIRSFCRFLDRRMEKEEQGRYTAIHYNLRHFTLINQDIGRVNADKVMWNHFNALKSLIGEGGIVCRLGGDSFLSVFVNELLDKVLEFLNGTAVFYDEVNAKRVMISACVGVYQIPASFRPKNSSQIMDKLMPAAAVAKNGSNGTVAFFDVSMLQHKDQKMRMQRLFPQALEKQEFHVYYQPKVNVFTGEIVGAEALCRWIHDGRIIPPMEFIPTLEENTNICLLDFYMLNMVCRDIRRRLDEGRHVVRVSVNLSRKHMLDPDLLENILKIVDDNHVPHEYVEIELTETTTDVEFRDLKRVVGGLQREEIYTSVDDFGMGYSSLNLIREIPWDVLKIDKGFLPVDGDAYDDTTQVMFKHVVAMAKELGLECITEGVETLKQVEILKQNGCTIAQGYHFDRPLPKEEFEQRLDKGYYEI